MNYLRLIRRNLFKKDLLHQAELVLASKSSNAKSSELNSRLIGEIARRKKVHQAEILLASKSSRCSSAKLNSRLAVKAAQTKRLHSAQMISMTK